MEMTAPENSPSAITKRLDLAVVGRQMGGKWGERGREDQRFYQEEVGCVSGTWWI